MVRDVLIFLFIRIVECQPDDRLNLSLKFLYIIKIEHCWNQFKDREVLVKYINMDQIHWSYVSAL
jgi:hypothetical protein